MKDTRTQNVVIVGAGLGGLSAAMTLAADGFHVTLLERAARPGGKVRALESIAGPVDAGPTVLTMKHVFEDLFRRTGAPLADYATLHREELLARHWWPDGSSLDLFSDRGASLDAIRAFGGAKTAKEFEKFANNAAKLYDAFQAPVMEAATPTFKAMAGHVAFRPWLVPLIAPGRSFAAALKGAFGDPRLQQLFGRYATYVGGSPLRSPAILSLIWRAEEAGVWRVEGGMRALADAMATRARDIGVEIICDAHVDRIETTGRRAAILTDGTRFEADAIVHAGDPAALHKGLLGCDVSRAVMAEAVTPRSLSANVWAFAATPDGPDLAHHNVFFASEPNSEFRAISAGRIPEDPTLYICAQDRGGGVTPPAIERFEMIANAAPTPSPSAPSQQEKDACQTRAFTALARMGLTFSPTPGAETLTTPPEFAALFPGSEGSLYGLSPEDMNATFKRPTARSAIPGLYLAGGGVHPGPGAPMATLSGLRAAETIAADLASTSTSPQTAMRGGT